MVVIPKSWVQVRPHPTAPVSRAKLNAGHSFFALLKGVYARVRHCRYGDGKAQEISIQPESEHVGPLPFPSTM